MENKSIPTAEQHYKNTIDYNCWSELKDKTIPEWMHEYAVLFAKYHREQQLEATVNNFYTNYIGLKSKAYIKQDLENAYSEDNIK